ncbi:MAG: hypothetical protein VX440_03855, partial [Pseudomonadota bacterium]|nr:hypothetical protein [Pseudomonadota bacterium]
IMKNIIALIISSFLASCAAIPGDASFIPENRHQEIMHITKIAPDWFKIPLTSESAIYAAATAVSKDYQMSIKKATLYAKVELADKISGNIVAEDTTMSMEKYVGEKLTTASEIESNAHNVVNMEIHDYEVSEVLTIPEGNLYRTFILIKKPLDNAADDSTSIYNYD